MRAFVLHKVGEPPTLAEVPDPRSVGRLTTATVLAAGLNPIDLSTATGGTGMKPAAPGAVAPSPVTVPRVLGDEGVLEHDGRRYYAERVTPPHGTFAERTLVDLGTVFPLPAGLDPVAAVPLGASGLPVWIGLNDVVRLQPGETVIVLGATGAAGQVAVQVARAMGAGRVVAAARNEVALRTLLDRGADEIVVLDGATDTERLLVAAEGGADVLFDPLFGPPLVAALGATNHFGRVLSIGTKAASVVELPMSVLFRKSIHTLGIRTCPVEQKATAFAALAALVVEERLRVDTHSIPLAEIESAWRRQSGSPHGKQVIVP